MSFNYQQQNSNGLRAASEKRNENEARAAQDAAAGDLNTVLEEFKREMTSRLDDFIEKARTMYEHLHTPPAGEDMLKDFITGLRPEDAAPPAEANRPRRNRRNTRRNNRRNNRRNSRKH